MTSEMHETLIFIKGQGGVVTRYRLDKFFTIYVRLPGIFEIPRQLLEDHLIVIEHSFPNDMKIILTDIGNEKIAYTFEQTLRISNMILTKLKTLSITGGGIDDIQFFLPRLRFSYCNSNVHFFVYSFGDEYKINVLLSDDQISKSIPYELLSSEKVNDLDDFITQIVDEVITIIPQTDKFSA